MNKPQGENTMSTITIVYPKLGIKDTIEVEDEEEEE